MLRAVSALILSGIFLISVARAYEVRDARGNFFVFDAPPKVATIVPSVTQNIYSIGADSLLLGNSRYCVYPEDAKNKVKLGGFVDPDLEKIIELKPQVFILPSLNDSRVEDKLSKLGIKCFFLNEEGLKNISADIRLLGELFQKKSEAEKVAAQFDKLVKPVDSVKKRKALFMFGKMAAGKSSFVGDIIDACGLENCADSLGRPWPELSKEFILMAKPEILFVEIEDDSQRGHLDKFYRSDSIWRTTPAVKNNRICYVPRSYVTVPSARVVEALKIMRDFCSLQK